MIIMTFQVQGKADETLNATLFEFKNCLSDIHYVLGTGLDPFEKEDTFQDSHLATLLGF